jgi:hypothetical protein
MRAFVSVYDGHGWHHVKDVPTIPLFPKDLLAQELEERSAVWKDTGTPIVIAAKLDVTQGSMTTVTTLWR